uniref:DUF4283 domain-containing protein n=1 Tax=Manihot esculenta TaxID=3983 RepID=A0A2C9UAB1_MANES
MEEDDQLLRSNRKRKELEGEIQEDGSHSEVKVVAQQRLTLTIKLLGKSIGYNYLVRWLKEIWKPLARIDVIAMDNGYFLVKFLSKKDLNQALLEGPWMIADHYLIVRRWCPNFDPFNEKIESLTDNLRSREIGFL